MIGTMGAALRDAHKGQQDARQQMLVQDPPRGARCRLREPAHIAGAVPRPAPDAARRALGRPPAMYILSKSATFHSSLCEKLWIFEKILKFRVDCLVEGSEMTF